MLVHIDSMLYHIVVQVSLMMLERKPTLQVYQSVLLHQLYCQCYC